MLLPSTKLLERSASWAAPSLEPETMMLWELRYPESDALHGAQRCPLILPPAGACRLRTPLTPFVALCRHSLSSAQRGSCRRGRRWSTPCPSMRSTSSTAARRASWLCSLETPERSSLKSVSRLMPRCMSGGKKARLRSSQGCVQLQDILFTFALLLLVFDQSACNSRSCSSTRFTCWTWSAFPF